VRIKYMISSDRVTPDPGMTGSECRFSSPLEDSDVALVERAKARDLRAFERLMVRYEPKIFRTILRITRNREDAEDGIQETFLRAYRSLDTFQGRSKFATWLTRIAINQALMCLRKRRNTLDSLDSITETEEGPKSLDILEWRANPEQHCVKSETAHHLHEVVNRLPLTVRTAFILRHMQELTTKEVAVTLGISNAAVKSRVMRARRKLRERLGTNTSY
jgi:RNA polymerase sigma-70 factor, ECF subfamily